MWFTLFCREICFVAKSVLLTFTCFGVEKNWAQNVVCGEKRTNIRYGSHPPIHQYFLGWRGPWKWHPCGLPRTRHWLPSLRCLLRNHGEGAKEGGLGSPSGEMCGSHVGLSRRPRAQITHNFVARLLTHKSFQATCLALGYIFMVVLGFAESASDWKSKLFCCERMRVCKHLFSQCFLSLQPGWLTGWHR